MLHPWIGKLREIDPTIFRRTRNKQGKMIDYAAIHQSFCGYYDDGYDYEPPTRTRGESEPPYQRRNAVAFNDYDNDSVNSEFVKMKQASFENKNNSDALKFFNVSKVLLKKHEEYLKRYTYSLVLEDRVAQAINVIKNSTNKYFAILWAPIIYSPDVKSG